MNAYRPRTGTGDNSRLLRPGSRVWRIVSDSAPKTPAVGGVRLTNQDFPPSRLDAPRTANPWRYALTSGRKWDELEPEPSLFDTGRNVARDVAAGKGKGQPGWLRPYECWPVFAHLRPGKRAPGGGELPPVGTWHVGERWSAAQLWCSVCGGRLPEGQRKYCGGPCAREGDLRRRRKRPRELPDDALLKWGCAILPKYVIELLCKTMAEISG